MVTRLLTICDESEQVVLLDRVVGKIKSRHLRCAPEMVELAVDR
jgi:hypothetical protein